MSCCDQLDDCRDELNEAYEEIQQLRELLAFAIEGLDSAPRSWGLDITHVNKIRRDLEEMDNGK
jgi:hypothetical protein